MHEISKKTLELVGILNSDEECSLEISKDNKYIARIKKDNKLRYIGSKYSVEGDIQNLFDNIGKIDNNTILIIFGLGAGEHIRFILNSLSINNKILIIEPNINIINEVLKLDFCNDILNDSRVALCFLDEKTKKCINDFIDDYSIDNTKIASFSNYPILYKDKYKIMLETFESAKNLKKIGKDTFNQFNELFFSNFIENIFALGGYYTVNYLKNLFKGKPAVVVSSGPSLTKNIHLLKEAQDKFIIISGPRTISTLIKNQIIPDFVCAVDPQDKSYDLINEYINLKIPLVFMDSSDNKIVKEQKGLRIIAANQGMEKHLEEMLGTKVDSLLQGGSVAHFCMGLAVYTGCSSIIFIGQDLAYTDDKFQAEGTYAGEMDELKYRYENNKDEWDKDKNYNIFVKDINGNKVRTSSVLNSYREEFEDLIDECNGIEFINSTEGGADIKGTKIKTLKESIDLYGYEIINKNLEALLPNPIVINEDEFIIKMLRIVDKLEKIKEACEEGIEISDDMLRYYKYNDYCDINEIFRRLDDIDATISNKENLGLLAYKLVSKINSIMNNEDFKEKANESEIELGIRLAKKNSQMYLTVIETVEDAIFTIKDKFIYINFNDSTKY